MLRILAAATASFVCLSLHSGATGFVRILPSAAARARGALPDGDRCGRVHRIALASSSSSQGSAGEAVPWWKTEEMDRICGPRKPFRIERVSPPPREGLGYAMLDARTSRGDVITVKESDVPLVVTKVRFLYDLVNGRYRLRTKILEVQTQKRYAVNQRLEQLVSKDEVDNADAKGS